MSAIDQSYSLGQAIDVFAQPEDREAKDAFINKWNKRSKETQIEVQRMEDEFRRERAQAYFAWRTANPDAEEKAWQIQKSAKEIQGEPRKGLGPGA